jgi:hypothetical protein
MVCSSNRSKNGTDNALISRTPAEIAGKFHPNLPFVRLRQAAQNISGGYQHARCAKPALKAMLSRKHGAKKRHVFIFLKSLNRLDFGPVASNGVSDT